MVIAQIRKQACKQELTNPNAGKTSLFNILIVQGKLKIFMYTMVKRPEFRTEFYGSSNVPTVPLFFLE